MEAAKVVDWLGGLCTWGFGKEEGGKGRQEGAVGRARTRIDNSDTVFLNLITS